MKQFLIMVIGILLLPLTASAEELRISIKGMVCAFCAQGIKKQFSALPEVQAVEPNMSEKVVKLTLKPGTTLSEEKIKELITDAGFETLSIERSAESPPVKKVSDTEQGQSGQ